MVDYSQAVNGSTKDVTEERVERCTRRKPEKEFDQAGICVGSVTGVLLQKVGAPDTPRRTTVGCVRLPSQ